MSASGRTRLIPYLVGKATFSTRTKRQAQGRVIKKIATLAQIAPALLSASASRRRATSSRSPPPRPAGAARDRFPLSASVRHEAPQVPCRPSPHKGNPHMRAHCIGRGYQKPRSYLQLAASQSASMNVRTPLQLLPFLPCGQHRTRAEHPDVSRRLALGCWVRRWR